MLRARYCKWSHAVLSSYVYLISVIATCWLIEVTETRCVNKMFQLHFFLLPETTSPELGLGSAPLRWPFFSPKVKFILSKQTEGGRMDRLPSFQAVSKCKKKAKKEKKNQCILSHL